MTHKYNNRGILNPKNNLLNLPGGASIRRKVRNEIHPKSIWGEKIKAIRCTFFELVLDIDLISSSPPACVFHKPVWFAHEYYRPIVFLNTIKCDHHEVRLYTVWTVYNIYIYNYIDNKAYYIIIFMLASM